MKKNSNVADAYLLSTLSDVYGVMQRVQGDHNTSDKTQATKCIGGGNCCNIGLVIPLLECHNIAKNIRKQYWVKYEGLGQEEADRWYNKIVFNLKDRLEDPDWSIDNESSDRKCVFYKGGCTIYEFRPFICRAYGTIAPVDVKCPRPRDENGSVVVFLGPEIDAIISRFDNIVKAYGEEHPDLNYSLYMPLGVLRFLLPEEEFRKVFESVDSKFTKAHEGYQHQLWKVRDNV